MMARVETELPHYFGANKSLFGVYHPAGSSVGSSPAKVVLLCPPLGQEQARTHRLYRQLAQALAADGIPSLRFDYYGSGDSHGDSAERDWERCLADAQSAAAELRGLSGCDKVIGFGARLGGSVVLATADAARFSALILWDPVFDGAAMVARLDALQQALLQDHNRFIKLRALTGTTEQWSGFAISTRLRQQLLTLRLDWSPLRSLALDSAPPGMQPPTSLMTPHGQLQCLPLTQPTPWEDLDLLEITVLSHELIQLTRQWLSGGV